MKRPVLFALADACGVSVEWLGAGRGPMLRSAELATEPPASPVPTANPSNLFGTLNIDQMAQAIEMVLGMLAQRNQKPTMRFLAQTILLAYDDLTRAEHQNQTDDPATVKSTGEGHESH